MSRTLHHGRSPEQRTAQHEKRLLALERVVAQYGAVTGIPDLRDALFAASGASGAEKCRNFDPSLASASTGMSSGARRYNAVYWPGGACTGMTTIVTQQGSYTDAAPNSGAALYSTDGNTLTRQAASQRLWNFATGERRVAWTGGAVTLAAGIYYVGMSYFASAVTTVPQWATNVVVDSTIWGGDTNNDLTPLNWSLLFVETGTSAPFPATRGISGLTPSSSSNLHYSGLY